MRLRSPLWGKVGFGVRSAVPTPSINIIHKRVKSYSGKIEIDQSADGKVVEVATFVFSLQYIVELIKKKQLKHVLRIIIARLACTLYFPHDPLADGYGCTRLLSATQTRTISRRQMSASQGQ